MSVLLAEKKEKDKKDKKDFSNLQIYYNIRFPLDDILNVLYPLFGQYYQYNDFLRMIYSINHIFGVYDKSQNKCIAYALINNDGKPGGLYLMLFGVDQSNQKHGTGTYLLEKIIQQARQRGYRYIYLHVHVENYKAIGLYEKVGFSKQEHIPNFYSKIPKHPPDAFRMILSFRP